MQLSAKSIFFVLPLVFDDFFGNLCPVLSSCAETLASHLSKLADVVESTCTVVHHLHSFLGSLSFLAILKSGDIGTLEVDVCYHDF